MSNTTILVVDDDHDILYMMSQILKKHNYDVLTAESAEQALNDHLVPPKREIKLLITDFEMPGVDGYQLYQIAHKLQPNLKTLIISGYSEDTIEQKHIYSKEATYFLQKPISGQILLQSVEKLLNPE